MLPAQVLRKKSALVRRRIIKNRRKPRGAEKSMRDQTPKRGYLGRTRRVQRIARIAHAAMRWPYVQPTRDG